MHHLNLSDMTEGTRPRSTRPSAVAAKGKYALAELGLTDSDIEQEENRPAKKAKVITNHDDTLLAVTPTPTPTYTLTFISDPDSTLTRSACPVLTVNSYLAKLNNEIQDVEMLEHEEGKATSRAVKAVADAKSALGIAEDWVAELKSVLGTAEDEISRLSVTSLATQKRLSASRAEREALADLIKERNDTENQLRILDEAIKNKVASHRRGL